LNDKLKKILIDILGVLVIASILGLIYNTFNQKGISLIREPEKIIYSSENDIFKDTNLIDTSISSESMIKKNDSNIIINNDINQDSIKKENKKDSINKLIKNEQIKNLQIDLSTEITDKSGYKNVNIEFVKKHLKDKRVTIIDARSSIDYNKGHIENAINIDPMQEDQNNLFNTIMSLPDDNIYILYCTGGQCDLSHHLYDAMKNFGFNKLYIFPGGWDEWSSR